MKNGILLAKQFYKNKILIVSSLAFLIVSISSIIFGIIACYQKNEEPLDYLLQSLNVSIFVYIYFLFVSNEYLYKIKQCDLEETLKCIGNGYYAYYLISFTFLISLALLYTIILVAINTIIYGVLEVNNIAYFWHIINNISINIFWISVVAILFGGVLSFIKIRVISYISMLFIVLMSSPLFELIASGVYTGTNINVYPIYDFFNIFPPLLEWTPIDTFGYSLLQYRVELIAFWILILSSILFALIFVSKRKKHLVVTIACFSVSLICLVGYFQPASKVIMSNDPNSGALADAYYYREHAFLEEDSSEQFMVKKYTLDLKINRNLQATATLKLENNECTCYDFTLYHGYIVQSVCDAYGKELTFTQDGDYISVETNNGPLDEITICYSGSSIKCFSNSQGICLPGWFAYYPHPGHLSLFNSEQQFFERILCPTNTEFLITVNTSQKVYCNLDEISENTFEGYSDGITLVSGFYNSFSYSNIEVVYPYLSTNEFSCQKIIEYLDEYKEIGIFKDEQKKIFVLPNTNMASVYERFCEFSDQITLRQLMGLPMVYEMQKIPSFKSALYNAYNAYKADIEYFNFIVDTRNDMQINNNTDVYLLLDKALNELGENYVEQQIVIYLNNDADNRQGYAFLNDLLEINI